MEKSKDNYIEEYRALHQELSFVREKRQRDRNYALTLFAALVGYGLVHNTSLLFVGAWILAIIYWIEFNDATEKMFQIGRYLEIFIESRDSGLRWYGIVKQEGNTKRDDKITDLRKGHFSPHAVMFILGAILVFRGYAQKITPETTHELFPYIVAVGLYLIISTHVVSTNKQRRNKWTETWQAIYDNLPATPPVASASDAPGPDHRRPLRRAPSLPTPFAESGDGRR